MVFALGEPGNRDDADDPGALDMHGKTAASSGELALVDERRLGEAAAVDLALQAEVHRAVPESQHGTNLALDPRIIVRCRAGQRSVEELLPAMKRGAVLVIHSTIAPATATTIAARAEALGIDVLDAPVTRTGMSKDGPFVYCVTVGSEEVA